MRAALSHETVTPAAVLTLLDGIERHGPQAPALLAEIDMPEWKP